MALKKSSDCKAVRIQTGSNKKVLSKEQKRFNLLIKKIENKKKLFKEWDSMGQEYRKRLHEEYNKLYD
jgi:sialic acid synthase SpsE